MQNNCQITELYRQIGRTCRASGAERVILLSSKNNPTDDRMVLELALDGTFDQTELKQICGQLWPRIEIKILNLNETEDSGLIDEAMEDGILL